MVVAAAAYGLYRFFAPDYLEDFEDDLDDEFEEDFFDDEDVKAEEPAEQKEEEAQADAEEPFEDASNTENDQGSFAFWRSSFYDRTRSEHEKRTDL